MIELAYRIKFFIALAGCCFFTVSAVPKNNDLTKDEVWQCVRWTWIDLESRKKVVCLDWRKEDCTKRLHKELCKGNKQ